MERAASYSTRGSRAGASLLGWEEPENLNPEERLECLRSRARQLNFVLAEEPEGPNRKMMALEYGQLCKRIHDAKGYAKASMKASNRQLANFIVDVAKERMTKPEFESLVRVAKQRMEESMHPLPPCEEA